MPLVETGLADARPSLSRIQVGAEMGCILYDTGLRHRAMCCLGGVGACAPRGRRGIVHGGRYAPASGTCARRRVKSSPPDGHVLLTVCSFHSRFVPCSILVCSRFVPFPRNGAGTNRDHCRNKESWLFLKIVLDLAAVRRYIYITGTKTPEPRTAQ